MQTAVLRDPKLSFLPVHTGPVFKESKSQQYELTVRSTGHDNALNRMSFSFMSPGSQLLLSAKATINFVLTVSGQGEMTEALQRLPIIRCFSDIPKNLSGVANYDAAVVDRVTGTSLNAGYGNMICMGEGCCIDSALTSSTCVINGAAMTTSDQDKYWRSLMRCWVSDKTSRRVWGNAWDRYDTKSVGVLQKGSNQTSTVLHDARVAGGAAGVFVQADHLKTSGIGYGLTTDSGVDQRCKEFMRRSRPGEANAATWTRDLYIKYPLTAGLFQPFSGEEIYEDSIFSKMPQGLANVTSCNITLLFKNLFRNICRQFGRLNSEAGANHPNNSFAGRVTVTLKENTVPELKLNYARLNSFRDFPRSLLYNIYRTTVIKAQPLLINVNGSFKVAPTLLDTNEDQVALPPSGCDRRDVDAVNRFARQNVASVVGRPAGGFHIGDRNDENVASVWKVQFNSVSLPQIPSYVLLTCQKNSNCYNLNHAAAATIADIDVSYPYGPLAAVDGARYLPTVAAAAVIATSELEQRVYSRYRAQNCASNFCWEQVRITVQSGNSSFEFSSTGATNAYQDDRDIIWEAIKRNTNRDFMKYSGQSDFERRCSCILLRAEQAFFGLSSSSVSYPISLSVSGTLSNRCTFLCGSQIGSGRNSQQPMIHKDPALSGECVMAAIYDNSIISVSEGGASVSAVSSSQADYIESISRTAQD